LVRPRRTPSGHRPDSSPKFSARGGCDGRSTHRVSRRRRS
jgi:hypothetical protein